MDDLDTLVDAGHDAAHPAQPDAAPGASAGPPAGPAPAPAWPHLSTVARRAGVGNPLRTRL